MSNHDAGSANGPGPGPATGPPVTGPPVTGPPINEVDLRDLSDQTTRPDQTAELPADGARPDGMRPDGARPDGAWADGAWAGAARLDGASVGARPRRHPRNVGWLLRRLTGVPEDVLDDVPSERARYIGLGWTMLGTATLATVGMFVLLSEITDYPRAALILPAIGWGLFILGIDYSIVSYVDEDKALGSMQQTADPTLIVASGASGSSAVRFGTRILLAVVLGVAIGESLVLAIFGPEATETLITEREADIRTEICAAALQLETLTLQAPPDYCTASASATVANDATEAAVEEPAPPAVAPTDAIVAELQTRIATLTADRDRLAADLVDAQSELAFATELKLCEEDPARYRLRNNGDLAEACSGQGGQGPFYRDAVAREQTAIAEQGRVRAALDQVEADLGQAQRQLADRTGEVAGSARVSELQTRITELETDLAVVANGTFGLGDRFRATEETVDWRLRWGLRLLFIAIDLTPVLIKMTMGTSAVDRIVALQRRQAVYYPHLQELRATERRFRQDWNLRMRNPAAAPPRPPRRFAVPGFGAGRSGEPPDAATGAAANAGPRRMADVVPVTTTPMTTTPMTTNPMGWRGGGPPSPTQADPMATTEQMVSVDRRAYRLKGRAGAGNFAELWYAQPINPDAFEHDFDIVIKTARNNKASHDQLSAEYQLYRRLGHPSGIPHLVGGDRQGLVLRYYPRTSIDRWFFGRSTPETRFSYDDLIGWLREIIDTLGVIWQESMVHGDGKPGNLVLTGSELVLDSRDGGLSHALLIDFGSSVEIGQPVRSLSPGHAAPEMLRDRSNPASPLIDVYSFLGTTSYYLLTGGVHPWQDQMRNWPYPLETLADDPSELLAYQKQWLALSRATPATDPASLNPAIPASFRRQITTWMAPDPLSRLAHGTLPHVEWQVRQHWETGEVVKRLKAQLADLARELELELGEARLREPSLGVLHPLAVPADDLPDFTVETDVIDGGVGR